MISKGCGEGDGEGTQPYVQQAPVAYGKPPPGLRRRMYDVIFEADTPAGRRFDIALVAAILLSILVVVLDSVPRLHRDHADLLGACEWGFTLLFTMEYVARLVCVHRPWRYAGGFFGVIDLLAMLPSYFSLLMPGADCCSTSASCACYASSAFSSSPCTSRNTRAWAKRSPPAGARSSCSCPSC